MPHNISLVTKDLASAWRLPVHGRAANLNRLRPRNMRDIGGSGGLGRKLRKKAGSQDLYKLLLPVLLGLGGGSLVGGRRGGVLGSLLGLLLGGYLNPSVRKWFTNLLAGNAAGKGGAPAGPAVQSRVPPAARAAVPPVPPAGQPAVGPQRPKQPQLDFYGMQARQGSQNIDLNSPDNQFSDLYSRFGWYLVDPTDNPRNLYNFATKGDYSGLMYDMPGYIAGSGIIGKLRGKGLYASSALPRMGNMLRTARSAYQAGWRPLARYLTTGTSMTPAGNVPVGGLGGLFSAALLWQGGLDAALTGYRTIQGIRSGLSPVTAAHNAGEQLGQGFLNMYDPRNQSSFLGRVGQVSLGVASAPAALFTAHGQLGRGIHHAARTLATAGMYTKKPGTNQFLDNSRAARYARNKLQAAKAGYRFDYLPMARNVYNWWSRRLKRWW